MVVRTGSAWIRGSRSAVASAVIVIVTGTLLSVGCTANLDEVLPDRKPSYKSSRSTEPLEVPPDLVGTALEDSLPIFDEGDVTLSQYENRAASQSASRVLPKVDGARIERSGQDRWLVVAAAPDALWPRLRDFWIDQGFALTTEDAAIGVMETDWAEKKTSLPAGALSGLTKQLSTLLYGVAFRDQYRTRIERGVEPGTTEIYISHRGAEQKIIEGRTEYEQRQDIGERVWQIRPSDPGLEAEMLSRLMIFLGVDESRATALAGQSASPQPRALIVRDADGTTALTVSERFSPAWRRVGLALDRGGFSVEDRNRSRGVFFVRYAGGDAADDGEGRGLLASLKFWRDDDTEANEIGTYQVHLAEEGSDTTRVVVLDADGERETGPVADRILAVLHELLE